MDFRRRGLGHAGWAERSLQARAHGALLLATPPKDTGSLFQLHSSLQMTPPVSPNQSHSLLSFYQARGLSPSTPAQGSLPTPHLQEEAPTPVLPIMAQGCSVRCELNQVLCRQ